MADESRRMLSAARRPLQCSGTQIGEFSGGMTIRTPMQIPASARQNPAHQYDDFDDDFSDAVFIPLLLSAVAGTDAHDVIWFPLQEKDAMNSRKCQEHRHMR